MSHEEYTQGTKYFTVSEAIDLCLNPEYIEYKFVENILHMITKKIQIDKAIITDLRSKTVSSKGLKFPSEKKQQSIFWNLTNYGKLASEVDEKIKKIVRILDKLTHQHENIFKNYDLLPKEQSKQTTRSMKKETDYRISNQLINALKDFTKDDEASQYSSCGSTGDTIESADLYKTTMEQCLEQSMNVYRKEFSDSMNVITENLMKLTQDFYRTQKDIPKIQKITKILDCFAAKDFVESINTKVDCMCLKICQIQKGIHRIYGRIDDITECARYTEKRIKEIQKKLLMINSISEIIGRLDNFDLFKKKILEELDIFTEKIEHLKITKACKEELDYIFEEKANRNELLKLVTLDFFKSVQDDLTGGIVQVLEQLMRDEIEWERAYKEIQLMLDVKADKGETTSLKKYIDCKLQIVQMKIDDLIRQRLTRHSAAVKIRLLKDARCITCTAEADINSMKYPIPTQPSLRHREFKCICEPRTRYCGGSHTVLGSDQKLIRNYKAPIKSLTPKTLEYGMIKGKDGRCYRSLKKCEETDDTDDDHCKKQQDVNNDSKMESCRCTDY